MKSYYRRLLFWMLALSLAPLLVVSIQGYHCARQAVVDRARKHLLSVLDARTAMFHNWIGERKRNLRLLDVLIAGQPPVLPLGAAGPAALPTGRDPLERVRQDNPSFLSLTVYDSRRQLRYRSAPAGLTGDGEAELSFAAAGAPGEVVLGRARLLDDGRLIVPARYDVPDGEDGPGGQVLALMDLSGPLAPILADRAGLGLTGKVYLLFPETGKVFASKAGEPAVQDGSALVSLLATARPEILEYRDHLGAEVLGVSALVPELGAYLVVETDRREAFEWARILGWRAFITGIITMVVAVLIAMSSSRRLQHPLHRLVAVTREVGRGKHDERVEPMEVREFDEVGRALNRMLDELDANYQRMVRDASLVAVGEMSSSIVHEMRTPLSSMKLNFQTMQEALGDDPEQAEPVAIVMRQFDRLERMLSGLLGYARPLELHRAPVALREVLDESLELLRGALRDKALGGGGPPAAGRRAGAGAGLGAGADCGHQPDRQRDPVLRPGAGSLSASVFPRGPRRWRSSRSRTRGRGSRPRPWKNSSSRFLPPAAMAPVWDWPMSGRSAIITGGGSRPPTGPRVERGSRSLFRQREARLEPDLRDRR